MALCGSSTNVQNDNTVNVASTMPRRSRTANATTMATPARTMIHRSPDAPPVALNQPSVEKMARRFDTLTFV